MEETTKKEPTDMEKQALEREQALRQREAAVELRERRAKAAELLQEKGLPVALTGCLCYADDESMEKSLEALETAFREQVAKEVAEQMKGAPVKSNEGAAYGNRLRSALGLE